MASKKQPLRTEMDSASSFSLMLLGFLTMENSLCQPFLMKIGSFQFRMEQSGPSNIMQDISFGYGMLHLFRLTGAPQVQLTASASDSIS